MNLTRTRDRIVLRKLVKSERRCIFYCPSLFCYKFRYLFVTFRYPFVTFSSLFCYPFVTLLLPPFKPFNNLNTIHHITLEGVILI